MSATQSNKGITKNQSPELTLVSECFSTMSVNCIKSSSRCWKQKYSHIKIIIIFVWQAMCKGMQITVFSSHKPSPAFFDYILPDQSTVPLKQGLQHFQHLFQTEKQQIPRD